VKQLALSVRVDFIAKTTGPPFLAAPNSLIISKS
jgi:hypothetical protein